MHFYILKYKNMVLLIYTLPLSMDNTLLPCLFPGIHFPGNHFPHFSMFNKHKENQSKETQFQSTKKMKPYSRRVFSFLYSKENTFLFFINKKCPLS